MAIEIINVGASPNDGNGDPIRDAFIKCNDNFDELDTTKIGGSGTDNFVAKFSGTDSVENSLIFDDGSFVGVNTTTPTTNLEVSGTDYSFSAGRQASNRKVSIGLNNNGQPSIQSFNSSNAPVDLTINPSGGNVGIGTLNPLGLLHLYKSGVTTRMIVDGDAGQSRIITYRTGGLQRFGMYVNNTSESGSNAGSDFQIRAYNDAGSLLSTPLFIKRSTGNVGIGTTSPGVKFVNSGGPFTLEPTLGSGTIGSQALLSNDGLFGLYSGVSSNGDVWQQVQRNDGNLAVYNLALQSKGGNIYIGTNAPVYGTSAKMQFLFNGLNEFGMNFKSTSVSSIPIHFTSSTGTQTGYIFQDATGVFLVSISDYRLKEDLNSFNGLDLISKIKVYDYKWKDQNKRSFGVMAHELQEVIPQSAFGEKDGLTMQGVDYSILVPILIKSIQEQQTQIDDLKQLINKL